ncbi:MAG: CoA transferase, partial [Chloroflexi bacterium]|nr:CoA transferase [Chloroflexota bacterium]
MEPRQGSQPLDDLRVIDLSHGIAGPYCTKLLADFGADVIKVERPGTGDYARQMGPFPGDVPHLEKSGLFLHLNTNKRSIVLDLKTAGGVEVVKELVEGADILVESFRPGVMDMLGLDYATLERINPNLVVTSISNFGQTGPYRDYLASELTLFAMGGKMNTSGLPERYPLKLGGNHVQYQAGNNAAMSSMFGYYAKKYTDIGGQHIDVSIFETQMASFNMRMPSFVQYQYTGQRGRRLGGMRMGYPSGFYACQDGYVLMTGGGAFWPRTVAMLGMPELLNDPRFAPPMGQMDMDAREEFEATIWLPWTVERTKRQLSEECQSYEVPCTPVNTIDDVVNNNPQFEVRDYWTFIEHPVAGTVRHTGSPIFNNNGWWSIRRPAPLLGQHTQEVLEGELGYSQEDARRLAQGESIPRPTKVSRSPATVTGGSGNGKGRLPLEGIRILDITLVFQGPYSTMFLADMGAEVIRVESLNVFLSTTRGQQARPSKEAQAKAPNSPYPNRDPGERPWNRAANFNAHARNKYSMTVDLATPEGKDVFRRLVEVSDIFIENNAPGSVERLGISYSVLSRWNPRLIMISSAGMGHTGPWAHFRGYGSQFEAAYGHASVTGYPDMDPEGAPASIASDASSGVTIVNAALMALHEREKTGKGRYIDLSMGENFLPHLGELFIDYEFNGRVAGPSGNRDHLWKLVQGAYPCAGDDEWIAISIGRIEQWHALCRLMGKAQLIEDERFVDMGALRSHHDEVDQIIGAWTTDQDNVELFHRLQKEGIIAGPVLNEPLAFADPQLRERGFFVPITAPEVGTHLYPSTAFKMSKVPFLVKKPPVRLGEDNDYVYRKVLRVSEEEYDHLKALGQIGMDY